MTTADERSFDTALVAALAQWGLKPDRRQRERMYVHFSRMVAANRRFNLTRITDPVEAAVRHYGDSCALLACAERRGMVIDNLLDMGTGAGFPAIALAVMQPQWRVTAIEATKKKADFVRRTAQEVQLTNLTVVHAHSAHWKPSERFGLVAARAVAPLPELLRLAAPLVRHGGRFVAYKTAHLAADETERTEAAARDIALREEEPFLYDLHAGRETLRRGLRIFGKCA